MTNELQKDPRTGLDFVEVPAAHSKKFAYLNKTYIHWFGVVDKLNRRWKPQKRVIFITDQCLYLCRVDGSISRPVGIKSIVDAIISDKTTVGFRVAQPDYDLCFKTSSAHDRAAILQIVSKLCSVFDGGPLDITKTTGDAVQQSERLQRQLRLQPPSNYVNDVPPLQSRKQVADDVIRHMKTKKNTDEVMAQLRRFYAKHAPEKTEEDIEKVFDWYEGRHDEMWERLEEKYRSKKSSHSTDASTTKMKVRLRRFYAKYAPEKTEKEIDTIANKFSNRSDEMWNLLTKKYGPEPDDEDTSADTKERLRHFYAKYDPNKTAAEMQKALDWYEGRYDEMWERLTEKYGPEPDSGETDVEVKERLRRFYAKHAPEKTEEDIEKVFDWYEGRHDEMWERLKEKYGVEQTEPAHASTLPETKERLRRFYAKYDPNKTAAEMQKALDWYEGRYDEMWERLTEKYGPEPEHEAKQTLVPDALFLADMKVRLTRFYAKYDPNKTETEIDVIVSKFGHRSDVMWERLREKYGPEPQEDEEGVQKVIEAEEGPAATDEDAAEAQLPTREEVCSTPPAVCDISATQNEDASSEMRSSQRCPSPPTETVVAPTSDTIELKQRLSRFYAKYAPEKTEDDIDAIVAKFGDRSEAMWERLRAKYGPEPEEEQAVDGDPQAEYSATIEAVVHTADTDSADQEAPCDVTSTESPRVGEFDETKEELRRFYAKYAPEKTEADLDATIAKYGRNIDAMWERLREKYGAQPDEEVVEVAGPIKAAATIDDEDASSEMRSSQRCPPPPTETVVAPTSDTIELKQRLSRFYAKYAPEKTEDDIDAIVAKFGDRSEAMWERLRAKYGPEPEEEHATPTDATVVP